MFSPTTFPCSAWYVADSLNVYMLEVSGVTGYSRTYRCDSPSFMCDKELFATRAEAISEAERKLAVMEARHTMACLRIERRRKAVERLKGGAV